ncbi:MAG: hypothetical protein HQK84_09435, partial [Nitrospinae bacterium]|nr:hypothetical protein [Nitrospinota bacterium]
VLGVTALASTQNEACEKAYRNVSEISWNEVYYRKDIGRSS